MIANGESEQAKALLAILIAELHVNSRCEILPAYRIGAPVGLRAEQSSRANRSQREPRCAGWRWTHFAC
jgi:hypothetical protein